MDKSLKNKVIFITGASRGIGREIALRCARDGAKIVIAAKSAEPHPTLEGTIFSVAEEVEKAGGKALPLAVDVREEAAVSNAVAKAVDVFGGIDILVNNASAINLGSTSDISMKRFDLIFSVNVRATFMCSKLCIPHLKKSSNPHILNLSPPLSMNPKWFKKHVAYTMSKYGMSMCTLGMAEEFKKDGIAVNSLWPKTLIATAAIAVNISRLLYHASRKPLIVADAAYEIITTDSRALTGNFFIDETILRQRGVTDFKQYSMHRFIPVIKDIFVDS
ncbi:Glucose 1-dehydrogenase 4 [Aquicella siphonis]|uniref:Glucose 1-dehydrogenase 4 n=1 Tax=Aquicella siphonis TaxID=254247 RepID=A0A5E4PIB3_9COXI|nr:NAD(P)-dependent oxidoreductase [Aquicella siphonis]VVC76091.1 Glucose 1-dehydrogenase 4 [Aquicella siphonis]